MERKKTNEISQFEIWKQIEKYIAILFFFVLACTFFAFLVKQAISVLSNRSFVSNAKRFQTGAHKLKRSHWVNRKIVPAVERRWKKYSESAHLFYCIDDGIVAVQFSFCTLCAQVFQLASDDGRHFFSFPISTINCNTLISTATPPITGSEIEHRCFMACIYIFYATISSTYCEWMRNMQA